MVEFVRQWGTWLDASGWSDVVGLIASVVGIAGVPFAVWNAWRANRAAEAARAAVHEAVEQLSQFESVANLSTTIEQIESLKELHRRRSWSLAVVRYSPIRRALIEIKEKRLDISSEQMKDIQGIIVLLSRAENEVDKMLMKNGSDIDLARLNRQLSASLDKLQAILHGMQRQNRDGQHA